MDQEQRSKIAHGAGFLAALDQSGGSTPKALELYGVPESAYTNDDEMFDLGGLIGAVIGEFVGSSDGLGFLLLSATSQINTPLAFAALFALSILGMLRSHLNVIGR